MAIKTFEVVYKSGKMVTSNVKELVFERQDQAVFDFKPGQFVTFWLKEGDAIKRRSYSISSMPANQSEFSIVISYIKGGIASETLFNLSPGDALDAIGPVGRLIMQDDDAKRYVMIGTGTGIAPYRSMLPQLVERSQNQAFEAVIIQGVQYREDLLFGDDFMSYADKYPQISFFAHYSRDGLADVKPHERSGYVQHGLEDLNLSPDNDIVYLCGNPAMIDDAFELLKQRGFDVKQIRREKYISSS